MSLQHHDPRVSSGRVAAAAVSPSNLKVLSAPFSDGPLGRFRVQQHLEERIVRLLAPGGAWALHKSRSVLAAVARALVMMVDHCGVAWPSEAAIVERTGLGYSSVHRALSEIAGIPGQPGALFSRRHLGSDEAYERDGKQIARPTYFYFADLSEAAALRLAPAAGKKRAARFGPACACGKCMVCTARKFGRGVA